MRSLHSRSSAFPMLGIRGCAFAEHGHGVSGLGARGIAPSIAAQKGSARKCRAGGASAAGAIDMMTCLVDMLTSLVNNWYLIFLQSFFLFDHSFLTHDTSHWRLGRRRRAEGCHLSLRTSTYSVTMLCIAIDALAELKEVKAGTTRRTDPTVDAEPRPPCPGCNPAG